MIGESIHHRELASPAVAGGPLPQVGRSHSRASCGHGVEAMVCYDASAGRNRTESREMDRHDAVQDFDQPP